MGAAGDLGHDAAVARVQVDLAADDRRQHRRAALDDGGGRLVARRLDAEDPPATPSSVELLEDGGAGDRGGQAGEALGVLGVSTSLAHMTMASSLVST